MKKSRKLLAVSVLSLLALAGAPRLQAGAIADNLAAHISFDGNLLDDSGFGNNGTQFGALGYEPGVIGSALTYSSSPDGSSFNFASLGKSSSLNFGATTNFTVAFWTSFTNSSDDLPFVANKDWSSGSNPGWAIVMENDGTWGWNYCGGDLGSTSVDYQDSTYLRDGTWHHIAVTFNRLGNASAYVNGVLVNQTSVAASTGTIDAGLPTNVGQDGTGTYTDTGLAGATGAHIDDLAIWQRELSAAEIARVYFEGANGVKVTLIPDSSTPYLIAGSPLNGSTNVSPNAAFSATIEDSQSSVDPTTVQLLIDGTVAAPSVQTASPITTVQFQPSALFAANSTHSYTLIYADDFSPPNFSTNQFSFTVANYTNIILPTPTYFESFFTTNAGQLPPGWTVANQSDPSADPGFNLNDPTSDAYKNWVVIPRQTVVNLEAAGIWEANNRLEVAPLQVVNGVLLTNLIDTDFVYAESDTRIGASIQYLFSPSYNLAGRGNVFVSYHSIYEQSDNNIGAVEYSVDGGATWLPIVYMLDGDPIDGQIAYLPDGTIDAVATMTNAQPNVPSLNGAAGYYGAFIGAAISQNLAPYISPRANGDPVSSKLVEQHRLPAADRQSSVQFRFAQAGYSSWYFGVSDFGVYSSPASALPPTITQFSRAGNSFQISWSGGEPPYSVQSSSALFPANWQTIATTNGTTATVTGTGGAAFFRIMNQ